MTGFSIRFQPSPEDYEQQHCPDCGYPGEIRHISSGLDFLWCVVCEQEICPDRNEPDLMMDWPDIEEDIERNFLSTDFLGNGWQSL